MPLFTRGAGEVARLAELAADDTARAVSRLVLVAALVAIATGTRSVVPWSRVRGALAAAAPAPCPPASNGCLTRRADAPPPRPAFLLALMSAALILLSAAVAPAGA